MARINSYITHSEEETHALGVKLGKTLNENDIVCFFGDLGSGKTTLIKGIAAAFDANSEDVTSPTFTYLNIYKGNREIYHFDLYRLASSDEFLSMGFDELFFSGGICCIEWSERITPFLPSNCIRVEITHIAEKTRKIQITYDNLSI